jgi:subtilisin family serine protease
MTNPPPPQQPRPIVVAVLDTGIDLNHPAFAGRLVPGYDFVRNDDNPSEEGVIHQNPSFGHGTHVAGIVALTAPEAKIMPLRVLDENGEGDIWRIQAAIIWAATHGADIVNMSMSYPNDANTQQNNEVLKKLMDFCGTGVVDGVVKTNPEVGNNRLIFVVGAGNGGDNVPIYPAALKSVDTKIAVAASTRYDKLATFSTINSEMDSGGDEWVKSVAPGEDIISAMPGGRYAVWSGTSMATPIVAGIAALAKSRSENLALPDLVERIEDGGFEWECFVPSRNYSIDTTRIDALCAVLGQECGNPPTNPCQ